MNKMIFFYLVYKIKKSKTVKIGGMDHLLMEYFLNKIKYV